MKTIYIHIGFNKTGTTSLQNDLVNNAGKLAQRGVLYPYEEDAIYIQRWQHLPLAAACPGLNPHWILPRKLKTVENAFDAVFQKIGESGCDTVVLSSEGWGIPGETLKAAVYLRELFHSCEVKIVAYIRRQDDYALSLYQEGVKDNRSVPFEFENLFKNPFLNFEKRLKPWKNVFGHENVIVRPFVPQLWPQNHIFLDFLSAIGADCSDPVLSKSENEGLDYRFVELLRLFNFRSAEKGLHFTQERRLRLIDRLQRQAMAFGFLDGDKRKLGLSTEQTKQLYQYFQPYNEEALSGSGYSVEEFMLVDAAEKKARLFPECAYQRQIDFIDQFIHTLDSAGAR